MEIIEKYHDKNWDWNSIYSNPNITIEIIEKRNQENLMMDWDWYVISKNKFIKYKI